LNLLYDQKEVTMKRANLRIFLMFGLFATLAIVSAHAQTSRRQTANIPFSFTVADKTFPAGEYTVERVNPASDKAVLVIKSMDGRMNKVVLTNPVQASRMQENARLVFNHYGDQYYLTQVWTPADDTGYALPQSRSERGLARNSGHRVPEQTTIALNIRRK
jgi:hypothetical protein